MKGDTMINDAKLLIDKLNPLKPKKPDLAGKFQGWLVIITKRKVIDWIRHRGTTKAGGDFDFEPIDDTEEEGGSLDIPHISDNIEGFVLTTEIREALEHLPERERQICIFYYFEGYIDREIGEMLGITEPAARQARRRALQNLKPILERRESQP
jgi:RNA polymerase sigma factor (sigma-70 family)